MRVPITGVLGFDAEEVTPELRCTIQGDRDAKRFVAKPYWLARALPYETHGKAGAALIFAASLV